MRAVDTNVLVRLIVRDDERQARAAEKFVSAGAWVPQIALVECVWVLVSVYGLDPETIAEGVERLLDHRDLVIQHADAAASALERYRSHPSVGFSDCLVLETARNAGHGPLGTFDRDLARLDGTQKL